MRFLAAWLGDPATYWPNLLAVVAFIALSVYVLRKVQAKHKIQK